MSKNRKRNRRSRTRKAMNRNIMIALIVLLVIAAGALIYSIVNTETRGKNTDEGQESGLQFPYELEDGRISIDSIFQFTGANPDNENTDGENIAALMVVNQSEQHLASAKISVLLDDDTKLTFEITDLPAGQSVMVFEKDNQIYELDDRCTEITDTAEFEESTELMEDSLSIDVQETAVTLLNNSGEDMNQLLLHCHCLIDGSYFGGLTYTYPVESIPAGQTITVQAEDCYLGEATVVRISADNGGE